MAPLARRSRGLMCHPHGVEYDTGCRADTQEQGAVPRGLVAKPVMVVGRVGRIGRPGGDGGGLVASSAARPSPRASSSGTARSSSTRKHTGKVGEALSDIRRIVEELVAKRDKKAVEIAEQKGRFDLRAGRCPDAAREGARERGRPDRRGREGFDTACSRGLTTIPWWLPSGREVSGTEHFPGRLAREPSDLAKRLRGPVLWLWLFRKVRSTSRLKVTV